MKIYTLLSTGKYHKVHGEDFLYHQYLGEKWFVGAVMDGCSSGRESHFASTLYAKALHKSCRMLLNMKEIMPDFDVEIIGKEAIAKFILGQLFEDIKKIKHTLFLDLEEILSTILLLVFDVTDNSAFVNASGDGYIVCNSVVQEIDHQNVPDYLGYHLDKKFDNWYDNHTESMNFKNVKDISIATDGIGKLRKNHFDKGDYLNPVDRFLLHMPKGNPQRALHDAYYQLTQEENYIPHDDIGIVRIIP